MIRSLRASIAPAFTMTVGAGVAHGDGDAANGEKVLPHGRGR
jgi:hypothetical protein